VRKGAESKKIKINFLNTNRFFHLNMKNKRITIWKPINKLEDCAKNKKKAKSM
jgi:hypothetical protein